MVHEFTSFLTVVSSDSVCCHCLLSVPIECVAISICWIIVQIEVSINIAVALVEGALKDEFIFGLGQIHSLAQRFFLHCISQILPSLCVDSYFIF